MLAPTGISCTLQSFKPLEFVVLLFFKAFCNREGVGMSLSSTRVGRNLGIIPSSCLEKGPGITKSWNDLGGKALKSHPVPAVFLSYFWDLNHSIFDPELQNEIKMKLVFLTPPVLPRSIGIDTS